MIRRTLHRARYLLLVLPMFAFFSTIQVGCGSTHDDYASEDQASTAGYGYGYRK
jgi:hypothetical protein